MDRPTNPERPPGDSRSLAASYFDEQYGRAADGDPWSFRTSPYEATKYRATLDHLPRPVYRSALEVGCSIGVFTALLADRTGRLLAVDLAGAAVAAARDRCRDHPHVRVEQADIRAGVPPGLFDLIVLAEVGYYWTPADFRAAFAGLVAALGDGGQIVLVHWRAAVPDYPQTGDEVHALAGELADGLMLRHRDRLVEARYRLDLWERPGLNPGARTT